MPGQSGNPGGRPKGVARTVRELCGGDPHELVAILLSIAKDSTARDADRIAASKELLERGWGKSPAVAVVDGDHVEVDEMTAEAVAIIDELVLKRGVEGAA